MTTLVTDIERTIQGLTNATQNFLQPRDEMALAEFDEPQPRLWWVLVCGEKLDKLSFAQREQARERLRMLLQLHDITLEQYVWVWDEQNRAQVVVREFAHNNLALQHAEVLAHSGLTTRVVLEWKKE